MQTPLKLLAVVLVVTLAIRTVAIEFVCVD